MTVEILTAPKVSDPSWVMKEIHEDCYFMFQTEHDEVIGNIYQHAYLMEEKNG